MVRVGGASASPRVDAKLAPAMGDCSTPRMWVGASMPSSSSTVGTTSMAWMYCWRTSPWEVMPLGHDTTHGSVMPPR